MQKRQVHESTIARHAAAIREMPYPRRRSGDVQGNRLQLIAFLSTNRMESIVVGRRVVRELHGRSPNVRRWIVRAASTFRIDRNWMVISVPHGIRLCLGVVHAIVGCTRFAVPNAQQQLREGGSFP